jgi:hypothetical protein
MDSQGTSTFSRLCVSAIETWDRVSASIERLYSLLGGTVLKISTFLVAAVALASAVSSARADNTLMSDSLTGSTPLAGSNPTVGTGPWTTYYFNNGGEVAPASGSDATGAGFAAVTTGNSPVDGVRSAGGVNVGAFQSHTDDGAYVPVTPATSGMISASGTFTFPNIAASSNPTAWAFIGLTTNLSSIPDVIANAANVGPWLLVRPASNGSDVVELYSTGGTTHQVTTTNTEVGTTGPHSMQIMFDPLNGTLDASVDGNVLLSTPYSYAANSVAVPTIDGFMFGNRTNTGQPSSSNPSTTFLANVSVTQAVPEPASLGLLGMGAMGLLARRRR